MYNCRIHGIVEVNNTPDKLREDGFMVVRYCENGLWYYGTYETKERAEEVAEEIGNGFVVEIA